MSGSGSSFGRISGGGGSYGSLTLGVTAEDVPLRRPEVRGRRPGRGIRIPYAYLFPYGTRGRAWSSADRPAAYGPPEPDDGASTTLPAPPSRRAAVRAPDLLRRRGVPDGEDLRGATADATPPGIAPRVRPPVPAGEERSHPLPAGECAEVRITTVGGIQWRQRVARKDFLADTPAEVASRLQQTLDRGDPLSLNGPDGSFTVRAALVKGLVVGPCTGA